MRQIYPPTDSREIEPGEVYASLGLPPGRHGRPYVVLNMVSTVDGKVTLNGSAAGIGSRVDRDLMRQIRSQVDAVMFGAATIRAETVDPRVDGPYVQWRTGAGLPAQPLAVAVSGSLEIGVVNRFLVNGPERTIVLTCSSAPAERSQVLAAYATLLDCGDNAVDLALGLRLLHERFGVRRLLCEGGPSLNQRLLDAELVDELFWTIAPKLAGGQSPGLLAGPDPSSQVRANLDLVSLHEHEGELFARYRVRRATTVPGYPSPPSTCPNGPRT